MMAVRRTLAALSLLFLAACSAKGPGKGSDIAGNDAAKHADVEAPGGARPPPIHYDYTSVLTVGDESPPEEKAYHGLLAACEAPGVTFPLTPLSADEVAKLGRTHVEAWIGPDKASHHEESWGLNPDTAKPCYFSLKHTDETEISEANGRSTLINNITREVDVQDVGPWAPVVPMPPDNGELTDAARQLGWSKAGDTRANGAPCTIWQDASGFQLCIWTGGRQWGYTTDGSVALLGGRARGDEVVLWAHPGRVANYRLETKVFTVGVPLDARAFVIPGGGAGKASP